MWNSLGLAAQVYFQILFTIGMASFFYALLKHRKLVFAKQRRLNSKKDKIMLGCFGFILIVALTCK